MTGSKTSVRIEKLVNKAEKWASSSEGRSKIKEAYVQAAQATKEFTNAQSIDPRKLREPFTL